MMVFIGNSRFEKVSEKPAYRELWRAARVAHPDDVMRQLEFFKESGSIQQYALAFCQVAQARLSSDTSAINQQVPITAGELECLFRALHDAIDHIDEQSPAESFRYIRAKSEDIALRAAQHPNL